MIKQVYLLLSRKGFRKINKYDWRERKNEVEVLTPDVQSLSIKDLIPKHQLNEEAKNEISENQKNLKIGK